MNKKLFLILFAAGIFGCTVPDRNLAVFPDGGEIMQAREVDYIIVIGGEFATPCDGQYRLFRTDKYRFPRDKDIAKSNDSVIREFIDAYNEKNDSNFNAIVDYRLPTTWWGIGVTRNRGFLCGEISGVLLEIE